MNHKKSEKGQALIVITLAAVVLFGFGALAIDGSRVFSDRRHAQNAADTAALAAALAHARGQDYNSAATDRSTSNGYDGGTNNDVVVSAVYTPSGGCSSTGLDITVQITSNVQTTLAQILGWKQLTNVVSATSRACDTSGGAGGTPLYNGNAVMSLNTGTCNGTKSKNLYVGGSGQLQVWAAGVGSASTDANCVDFSGGNTQIEKQDPVCPSGLYTAASSLPAKNIQNLYNPDGCKNFIQTGVSVAAAPADLGITCSGNATLSNNQLSPGNWNTSVISPSGISLKPGTYCITGDIKLTGGTLSGTGVTLVMLNGGFKMTGGSTMNITAPSTATDSFGNNTKGLLIYYPPANSSDLNMEGSSNGSLSGTVLAQNSNCFFAGSSQIQKAKLQFICSTFQINGNGQGELVWDSSVLYSPQTTVNPSITMLK